MFLGSPSVTDGEMNASAATAEGSASSTGFTGNMAAPLVSSSGGTAAIVVVVALAFAAFLYLRR